VLAHPWCHNRLSSQESHQHRPTSSVAAKQGNHIQAELIFIFCQGSSS
jgi:hypothetical protein